MRSVFFGNEGASSKKLSYCCKSILISISTKFYPFLQSACIYLAAGLPLLLAWRCFVFDWPSPPSRRDAREEDTSGFNFLLLFKSMEHILTNKSHNVLSFFFYLYFFLARAEMPTPPIIVRPSSPPSPSFLRKLYFAHYVLLMQS